MLEAQLGTDDRSPYGEWTYLGAVDRRMGVFNETNRVPACAAHAHRPHAGKLLFEKSSLTAKPMTDYVRSVTPLTGRLAVKPITDD